MSHSRDAILSELELVHATYPGDLKTLVREKTCRDFRAEGHAIIDTVEWEDDLGWHYRISDEPIRRGAG